MPKLSAECQDFSYWCELDIGSHFCVLHAVSVLLFPDWKQEESVGVVVATQVFNWLCGVYFFDGKHIVDFSPRTNIVYDAIYFIIGGLIFLYRKELAEFALKYKIIA